MGSLGEVHLLKPTLDISLEAQTSLLHGRVREKLSVPGLHLNTVQHRRVPCPTEKIKFRIKLLQTLRQGWLSEETEARFLEAVHIIESDGCALFAGLIDKSLFGKHVAEYDKLLSQSGNESFMHSYVNLAHHIDFLTGGDYTDAFAHPLLIALISYLMGGPIRIMDLRAKDTEPISINAQDNMLHVDNTPFKEEYKILLNWERSKVKGPSGQNFTFLPWTHKGNRDILVDDSGLPSSTERDSLFSTEDAIEGLFRFQKNISGISRVVEAAHPDQPLAVVFPAGSLVHHRYRTENGNPRSCIIAAFHLSSNHPGQLIGFPSNSGRKKSLIEFLVGHQDEHSSAEFLDLLLAESLRIESKILEIYQSSHPSTLLDIESLSLSGEKLVNWRNTVIAAPNPLAIRLNQGCRLSDTDLSDIQATTEKLVDIMMYDKHGLLQMILYEDGREEIRKPARKRVGEMKKDICKRRLKPWIPQLIVTPFSALDLTDPKTLRVMCDAMAMLATNMVREVETSGKNINLAMELTSLSRLMMDLGEAITRCEGVETFVSTSLFLFWTAEDIYSRLNDSDKNAVTFIMYLFLRNYVASVLLVEAAGF